MQGFASDSQARVMVTGKLPACNRDAEYDAALDALLARAATEGDTLDALAWLTQTPSERMAFTDEIVDAAISTLTGRLDESEFQVWSIFMMCNPEVTAMVKAVAGRHARTSAQAVAA